MLHCMHLWMLPLKDLKMGPVRLGELGSLRISLHSKGKDVASEVNTADINGASVIFTPGTRIKTMIKTAKFQKQ